MRNAAKEVRKSCGNPERRNRAAAHVLPSSEWHVRGGQVLGAIGGSRVAAGKLVFLLL